MRKSAQDWQEEEEEMEGVAGGAARRGGRDEGRLNTYHEAEK